MKLITKDIRLTPRTYSTAKYMNDVYRHKVMTPEEELDAFKRLKAGDPNAKEEIILANLKFVVACAKHYLGCGVPLDDLISEGNIGLIKAVDKFDYTKGFKFISYAVNWIKQTILVAISEDSRTIRLPKQITAQLSKIKREIEQLEARDGYLDTEKLAKNANVSESMIKYTNFQDTRALDEPIGEDGEVTLIDLIKSPVEEDSDQVQYFEALFSILTTEEADIVKRLYGFAPYYTPQKIESIANYYSSRYAVSTIYKKALGKLKEQILTI